MFIKSIISKSKELDKFLKTLNIELLLTKKQKDYLVAFIFATILKGYNGKIIDITEIMFVSVKSSILDILQNNKFINRQIF